MLKTTTSERVDYADASQNRNAEAVQGSLDGIMNQTKSWQAEILALLNKNNWKMTKTINMSSFSTSVSEATENQRAKFIRLEILETLQFTGMDDRYERIANAYRQTFEWVFTAPASRAVVDDLEVSRSASRIEVDEWAFSRSASQSAVVIHPEECVRWDSFVGWLHEDEPLYWCTGKPGSGKSTLMKFLYNDPRTYQGLSSWLGVHPLIRAGFFFWNSGTTMQMSRMGLLQSLLYQCLDGRPDLVPDIFPKRWKNHLLFGGDLRPWGWGELTHALKTLIQRTDIRFLFFIDGLDEFNEEPSELTELIVNLSASQNIKLCVASRPWLVFEEAFDKRPRLRLEDLTKRDIQLFVSEKLQASIRFSELQRFQPQAAQELIYEVSDKASGVFLWVYLVVNSLLEGLRDGDDILELAQRLLLLPSDLEQLFRKILDRLDAAYFEQASKLFQLVRAAFEPPTLLTLAFAEFGQEASVQASCEPISEQELSFRGASMKRRLNSRCKGLLEAPDHWLGPYAPVQYLHRTVRDFMKSQDVWDYVQSGAADFDPNAALRGSFMLQLKRLEATPSASVLNRLWVIVSNAIKHATIDEAMAKSQIPYLDELDRAGSTFSSSTPLRSSVLSEGKTWLDQIFIVVRKGGVSYSADSHWTSSILLADRDSIRIENWNHGMAESIPTFVDFAFMSHIYSYVEYKLECGAPVPRRVGGKCFLCSATQSADVREVRLLLDNGVDPNHTDRGQTETPWYFALVRVSQSPTYANEDAANMIEFYLNHNADPWKVVIGQSIEKIIKNAFGKYDAERTRKLLSLLDEARKKRRSKEGSERLSNIFKRNHSKEKNITAKLKRFSLRDI